MAAARPFAAALGIALLAASPAAAQEPPPNTEPGGALYQKLCSQCHGENGDGLGVAAPRLLPKPRDFTAGKYKVRTTPSGALPTDDDLRRILLEGMPYTSMPGWSHLPEAQINELIAAVKSFSPDFANPERKPTPIPIPKAPAYSTESAEKGKQVYVEIGCGACHGELGRGDGTSAPTLKDDWGNPLRPADLTKRWTYRGGSSREDIYRTFTTGMNGTPMPSFAESLTDEQRWQLVDFIVSLEPRYEPGYSDLLQVAWTNEEIDLSRGAELFAEAPPTYVSVVGQITEPGRAFHPSANGVNLRAVYNAREIAFELTWHDMKSDTSGRNAPNLVVPPEEDQGDAAAPAGGGGDSDSVWGDAEADATPAGGEDFWGEAAAPAAGADAGGGDDFWGESAGADSGGDAGSGFSDAVALQLPVQLPTGIRKPYFLFGDATNPVDLWFVDLATKAAQRYNAAGSGSITLVEGEDVSTNATYDRGLWTVTLKRSLRGSGGVTFAPGQYVPLAVSLWDGGQNERGSKRGLTQWFHLYTLPREKPSPVRPMIQAALAVLALEVLLVFWVRRRNRVSTTREVEAHG